MIALKNLQIISTLYTLNECNSHEIIVLGDFNIKCKKRYINDKATTEGAKIEFVTSKFVLRKIINEPTRFRESFILYWSHFYITTKLDSGFRCSSIFTPKLPSSNYLCKVAFWNEDISLPRSCYRQFQKCKNYHWS